MKKIFSIALLIVFLFNVVGYYGIYLTMLRQAQVTVSQQIENDQFTEEQTITLEIPITLPYTSSEENYERVNGDFEWQGEYFKLVKQKYQNDTLFIVCLKNSEKKKAVQVFSELAKLSTDQSSASGGQNVKSINNFIKDYSPVFNTFKLNPYRSITKNYFPALQFQILDNDFPVFGPPPELVA